MEPGEIDPNLTLSEPFADSGDCPSRERWFHATLARKDADQILRQYQAGSYLIRKSPDQPTFYRLSVVGHDEVRNYIFGIVIWQSHVRIVMLPKLFSSSLDLDF